MLWGVLIFLAFVWIIGWVIVIQQQSKQRKEDSTKRESVEKTKLIDSSHTATASTRTKAGSAAARGLVGGALLGPVGAIAGVASGKKKTTVTEHHTTTFMVFYKNGERKAETVENNTERYQIYLDKLELE